MKLEQFKKIKIPETPGVYFWKKGSRILYIGKATSLKDRVRSYFAPDLIESRGQAIVEMVFKADSISFQETDTALEALILEAELIKKHQPIYNVKEKDNRSFNYVVITNEPMPRVLLVRGRTLKVESELKTIKAKYVFGPYTSGGSIREGLRIIRRIFPFIDRSSIQKDKYEFYRQLGLTPDTRDAHARARYQKNIRNIVLFFKGKKQAIVHSLEHDMKQLARRMKFEEANEIKKQLFALQHINDIAVVKNDFFNVQSTENSLDFRIEAYDIAHLNGKSMVGVMTVVTSGVVDKAEYKKFIIKSVSKSNDTGALHEVLMRRFRHTEWGVPSVVVTDGGEAQMNVARQVLDFYQLKIPVVSVVKDDRHRAREILGDVAKITGRDKEVILANNEAHRFAITFHKEKRAKVFLEPGSKAHLQKRKKTIQ